MSYTQNEIAALKMCLNYNDRASQADDNHSDASPVTIAKALGWDMQQVGGLLSSLEKKGVAYVDDRSGDHGVFDVSEHIVYLTKAGIDAIFNIIEAA